MLLNVHWDPIESTEEDGLIGGLFLAGLPGVRKMATVAAGFFLSTGGLGFRGRLEIVGGFFFVTGLLGAVVNLELGTVDFFFVVIGLMAYGET